MTKIILKLFSFNLRACISASVNLYISQYIDIAITEVFMVVLLHDIVIIIINMNQKQ